MPLYDRQCTVCGCQVFDRFEPVVPVEVPPCPSCGGTTERVWLKRAVHVRADSIPGGMLLENVGDTPVRVYSHSERQRLLKERGLMEFVRHQGKPGSDKSEHTTKWT